MHDPQPISVEVELPPRQARALAELCKRIGWSDCRTLSVDEQECRAMIAATDRVRAALEDVGVSVR